MLLGQINLKYPLHPVSKENIPSNLPFYRFNYESFNPVYFACKDPNDYYRLGLFPDSVNRNKMLIIYTLCSFQFNYISFYLINNNVHV